MDRVGLAVYTLSFGILPRQVPTLAFVGVFQPSHIPLYRTYLEGGVNRFIFPVYNIHFGVFQPGQIPLYSTHINTQDQGKGRGKRGRGNTMRGRGGERQDVKVNFNFYHFICSFHYLVYVADM